MLRERLIFPEKVDGLILREAAGLTLWDIKLGPRCGAQRRTQGRDGTLASCLSPRFACGEG